MSNNFPLNIIYITGNYFNFIQLENNDILSGKKISEISKEIKYLTYEDIEKNFPENFKPDIIVFFNPEYHAIPIGIEKSEAFLITLISDWNVNFIFLKDILMFFDFIIVDIKGINVLKKHGFDNVEYFPIFSLNYNSSSYEKIDFSKKEFDIVFIGNVNHNIQVDRAKYLYKIAKLSYKYNVLITYGIYGSDYINLLAKSKLVFNKTIRNELNIRVFESLHSNSLLLLDDNNLEVDNFLIKNKHYIPYNYENVDNIIESLLEDNLKIEDISKEGNNYINKNDKEYFNNLFYQKITEIYTKNNDYISKRKSNNLKENDIKLIYSNNCFLCIEELIEPFNYYWNFNYLKEIKNSLAFNTYIIYKYLFEKDNINLEAFFDEIKNGLELYPNYLPLKINYAKILIEYNKIDIALDFLEKQTEYILKNEFKNEELFKGFIINEKYSRFWIELEKNLANKDYDKNIFLFKIYEIIGDIYYKDKKYIESINYYNNAVKIIDNSYLRSKIGNSYYNLENFEKAYQNFVISFELDTFNIDNFKNLIHLEEDSFYSLSELNKKDWMAVVEALPAYKIILAGLKLYPKKALEYKKKIFEKEPNYYLANKILEKDPFYEPAIIKKAEFFYTNKEYSKAIDILSELIDKNPSEKIILLISDCIENIESL